MSNTGTAVGKKNGKRNGASAALTGEANGKSLTHVMVNLRSAETTEQAELVKSISEIHRDFPGWKTAKIVALALKLGLPPARSKIESFEAVPAAQSHQ